MRPSPVRCRGANVTADQIVRSDPGILVRAQPHVGAVRGKTVDQAMKYGIEHGVDGFVLFVAQALAADTDGILA